MRIVELDYNLPQELIAQRPLERRDASRMLVLDRRSGLAKDRVFADFPNLLRGDELLVCNNARVIPARFFGRAGGVHSQPAARSTAHEHLQGRVEVFLARHLGADTWEALVRPGRKLPVGERIIFGQGELEGEILERGELGLRTIQFRSRVSAEVDALLESLGHVPLPPYIERDDEISDRSRYQTVFAKRPGAVAAPTAGLHFTPEILEAVRARCVETCELTLDVGLGTFQPIHVEDLKDHVMHGERYEISPDAASKINSARRSGKRILAVGTTVVRALEDAAVRAMKDGSTEIVAAGGGGRKKIPNPGGSILR